MQKTEVYLTDNGTAIYEQIKRHCELSDAWKDIYRFQAMVLANAFDLYQRTAAEVNRDGYSLKPMESKDWNQVSPAYTVMKNECMVILKLSRKFRLDPMDIVGNFKETKPKKKRQLEV